MATATAPPAPTRAGKPKRSPERDRRFQQLQQAANLLGRAGDPTRLQILLALAEGEQHVGALCDRLGQSQPGVSYHLTLLRASGIVTARRQGKHQFYALTDPGADLVAVVTPLFEPAGTATPTRRRPRRDVSTTPETAHEPETDADA
jgi:DNA-binding transcriptional ArsR family regulator